MIEQIKKKVGDKFGSFGDAKILKKYKPTVDMIRKTVDE